MKILIAGAAGFIGTNLCEYFLKKGYDVFGIDNFCTGRKENIERLLKFKKFHFTKADVIKQGEITIRADIDWVMNFASPASPEKYKNLPKETLLVNSIGNYNLLELAKKKQAKFLLASSSEVYGDPCIHPQPETYYGNVNPIGYRSVYDEGKRFAEAMVMSYNREQGVSTRIARIFNTYGPFMCTDDGRVITNFIKQILKKEPLTVYGDGTQTRSFQYIDDLLRGIERLMETDYSEPINLGNPQEVTILELIDVLNEIFHTKVPVKYMEKDKDDPNRRKPDISKAQEILKWSPNVSLREGLEKMIRYMEDVLNIKDSLEGQYRFEDGKKLNIENSETDISLKLNNKCTYM